jgi:uncharacterized protein (DUF2062 family)
MFARRTPRSALRRLREALWPSMGFRRAARYAGHRVARLPDSPGAIAGGFAWGAAATCTPFVGLHLLLAAFGAWASRCNLVASALGTTLGNPWTFPFIWAATYQTGSFMLGEEAASEPPLESLAQLFALLWRLAGEAIRSAVGLDGAPVPEGAWREAGALAEAVLWPMAVGSAPYALATWLVVYFIGKRALVAYRGRREGRLRARREKAGAPESDVPNI